MSDAKKTDTKAKATGTTVQPGAKVKGAKEPTPKAGTTDVLEEKNTNQSGADNNQSGQGDNQPPKDSNQSSTSAESSGVDNQLEAGATGTQGSGDDSNKVKSEPKQGSERKRIAKSVFSQKSGLSVIYFTSDLVPFGSESDALKHAAKLNDKTVTPITKED